MPLTTDSLCPAAGAAGPAARRSLTCRAAAAARAQVADAVALFAACRTAPYCDLREALFQHLRRSTSAMSGRALLRLVLGLADCRCAARAWAP
jgi:hypothetical protein